MSYQVTDELGMERLLPEGEQIPWGDARHMFELRWCGQSPYSESYLVQWSALKDVQNGGSAKIMGFEYPSTITLGIRSHTGVDLLKPVETLKGRGLSIVSTDRGGQATIHSPGQLVIYPVLPLRVWNLAVKDYVGLLMETTSIWLSHYGVEARCCKEYPGVFTQKGKIAFIGIGIRKGVSFHGLSINVSNDLSLFSVIKVCGVHRMALDSMVPYPQPVDLEPLFREWCSCFSRRLDNRRAD